MLLRGNGLNSRPSLRSNKPLSGSRLFDHTESSNLLHMERIFKAYIKGVSESSMHHPATQPTSAKRGPKGPLLVWKVLINDGSSVFCLPVPACCILNADRPTGVGRWKFSITLPLPLPSKEGGAVLRKEESSILTSCAYEYRNRYSF